MPRALPPLMTHLVISEADAWIVTASVWFQAGVDEKAATGVRMGSLFWKRSRVTYVCGPFVSNGSDWGKREARPVAEWMIMFRVVVSPS